MNLFLLYIATILATAINTEVKACDDICAARIQNETLRIAVAFELAGLLDNDILPAPPTGRLEVKFETAEAELGNFICPVETIMAPSYDYEDADPVANYTLVVMNVDTPSRVAPGTRAYLMSLCFNIKGTEVDQKNADQIAPWINSYPTPGGGEQRIVALLYEQCGYINPRNRDLVNLSVNRVRFNLTELVSNYSLSGPKAGNFWVTSSSRRCDKFCSM